MTPKEIVVDKLHDKIRHIIDRGYETSGLSRDEYLGRCETHLLPWMTEEEKHIRFKWRARTKYHTDPEYRSYIKKSSANKTYKLHELQYELDLMRAQFDSLNKENDALLARVKELTAQGGN